MYEHDHEFVAQIVPYGEPRVFTLAEARALMPLILKITTAAHKKLEPLRARLQDSLMSEEAAEPAENEYRAIVQEWIGKLRRLGVTASNLWVVHFDTGDGQLCWRFPELRISSYHLYDDCEHGRRSLEEYIELFQPDWA